jgi:hypothetical protein
LPLRERPLPQDEYSHKGMWKAPDANPMTTADNGIQYPTDLAVDEAILDADHTAEHTATAVQFQLTAEPWEGNHRNYLQQTPLWGPFEITPNIVQKDLERIVPMIGLSDIDVRRDSPPPRVLHRWSETMARRKTLRQMHEEGKLASQEPRKTEDAGDTG